MLTYEKGRKEYGEEKECEDIREVSRLYENKEKGCKGEVKHECLYCNHISK